MRNIRNYKTYSKGNLINFCYYEKCYKEGQYDQKPQSNADVIPVYK